MTPSDAPVLVLGATGFTGGLTTHTLLGRGIPVVIAGRRADRLALLQAELPTPVEAAIVDVTDTAALGALLRSRPFGAVVSCAGPYAAVGEGVVEAAVQARVPYLDCTGEQGFMRRVETRFDALAQAHGVAVVNAFAFEYALGDWLAAQAAVGLHGPSEVNLVYRLDSPLVSRGTYLSMKGQATEEALAWVRGAFVPWPMGGELARFQFPGQERPVRAVAVPFGEIVTLRRHLPVDTVKTFMTLPPRQGSLSHLLTEEKAADGRPFGPSAAERAAATFGIGVRVSTPGGEHTRVLEAADPYGLTAALLAWGADRLRRGGAPAGVLAPSQLVPPEEGLAFVASLGGRLEV